MTEGNAAGPLVILESDQKIPINNNFKVIVDVKFGQGTPFQGEPVVPTLFQIRDVVSDSLKAIERLTN